MAPRSFVLFVLVGLATLAVACDLGKEQRGALPSYTPAAWISSPTATPLVYPVDMADQIAHAALPPANVLGAAWELTDRDDFSPDDNAETAPACAPFVDLEHEFERVGSDAAGRGKQGYSAPKVPGRFPTLAGVEIQIHSGPENVSKVLRAYRDVFSTGEFAQCMAEAFEANAGKDYDASGKSRASRVVPPDGWESSAIEVDAVVRGTPLTLRWDMYALPFGNGVAQVDVVGEASAVTEDLVRSFLDTVSDGMAKLAADPSADPHGTLGDAARSDAGFSADDFPANSLKPVQEYVQTFCDASKWWLDWLGDRQLPEMSGTNSEVRGTIAAFLNGLRDGMDMYIDRVIEAGYPDSPDGQKLAADIVGVLQGARDYYDDAANRVEGFSTDPAEFQLKMADLELDLRKGALQIIEGWVRISREYDVSAFADAVAATPGCKAPWDDGGPSGTF